MIYITGATGHIGNNLVRELAKKGYDFKILARKIT
ncbi:MAG: NAD-dependent epimerase/dehydratase family protein, partial [Bacillota bacterium]